MTPLPSSITYAHQPSRKQAILFFLFTMALVGFIIAWVFVINKGTLSVSGEVPFTISVGSEKVPCAASPCSVVLKPGSYTVTLQKSGYFDDAETAQVRLGGTATLAATFRFIPVVEEVKDTTNVVPGNASINILLQPGTADKLPNFPKNSSRYAVSPSGKNILAVIGKDLYVYSVADKSATKLPLSDERYPSWLGDNDLVYLTAPTAAKPGQTLTIFNIASKKSSSLVVFERPLSQTAVDTTPNGNTIIVYDSTADHLQCYAIDREKKTRRRFDIPLNSQTNITNDYFIYESGKDVTAVDFATLKEQKIPATNASAVTETAPGVLLFVSSEQQDNSEHKVGPSINQALEDAQKAAEVATTAGVPTPTVAAPSTEYITELDVAKNVSRTLATVSINSGEAITGFTPYPEGKAIYFTENTTQAIPTAGTGVRIFALRLAPR